MIRTSHITVGSTVPVAIVTAFDAWRVLMRDQSESPSAYLQCWGANSAGAQDVDSFTLFPGETLQSDRFPQVVRSLLPAGTTICWMQASTGTVTLGLLHEA